MSTELITDSTDISQPILNIAAYRFVELDDLESLREWLLESAHEFRLKGTILLSPEGINMFLAGIEAPLRQFLERIQQDQRLSGLETKESWTEQQPFNRMLVRLKKEIISFGVDGIEPRKHTSPKLPPAELKQWLDEGRKVTLLDTRNDYETELGTFENAVELNIESFREFIEAAKQLPEETKKQPVVMFCTGGIRCEKAGPYMESLGFEHIYQLEGGILKYFEECGPSHYRGDCFVFDQRVAVDATLQPTGHALCFVCQRALSVEDQQSPRYVPGASCPHCFESPESKQLHDWQERERQIQHVAAAQPGAVPYENVRRLYVPGKFDHTTVIEFLTGHCRGSDTERWLSEISGGRLTYANQHVAPDQIVRAGQCFEHRQPGTVEPKVATEIGVVYEDDAILVLNKPAPLALHPSGRFNRNTLIEFLKNVYHPQKLRIAHRLDANTSGLVVVCRKYAAVRGLMEQFASQTVRKTYLARVHGRCETMQWTNEQSIAAPPVAAAGARIIDSDGKRSVTNFNVLAMDDETTWLTAIPKTGRTNQIRVHLWHDGHPVLNDPMYLPHQKLGESQTKMAGEEPMCLHAWRLEFEHPITGDLLKFEAPRPSWADYSQSNLIARDP